MNNIEEWSISASVKDWNKLFHEEHKEIKDASDYAKIILKAQVNLSRVLNAKQWTTDKIKALFEYVGTLHSPHERAKIEEYFSSIKNDEISEMLHERGFKQLAAKVAASNEQLVKILDSMHISEVEQELIETIDVQRLANAASRAKKGFIKCYHKEFSGFEEYRDGLYKELEKANLELITYVIARVIPYYEEYPLLFKFLKEKICDSVELESDSDTSDLGVVLSRHYRCPIRPISRNRMDVEALERVLVSAEVEDYVKDTLFYLLENMNFRRNILRQTLRQIDI